MDFVTDYWHQIVFLIAAIIVAVRLESEVKGLRKDLDGLTKELNRRDTYVETVKQRSEIDIMAKFRKAVSLGFCGIIILHTRYPEQFKMIKKDSLIFQLKYLTLREGRNLCGKSILVT